LTRSGTTQLHLPDEDYSTKLKFKTLLISNTKLYYNKTHNSTAILGLERHVCPEVPN